MSKIDNPPLKVASFFSGIGGFDLGFENAGMGVVFQCEINQFGRSVLKDKWPNIELAKDINESHQSNRPSRFTIQLREG